MFARVRSMWLAGGGALVLSIVLSGVVAAATILTALTVAPAPAAPVADTSATFEDTDGNGVDDDCQTDVVADPVAAASAETAADLDGDGAISVTEAAHSDRTGGTNCNHGGYVSTVAHGGCTDTGSTDETDTEDPSDAVDVAAANADEDENAEAETDEAETDEAETDESAECAGDQTETPDESPTDETDETADTCDAAVTEPADEPATVEEVAPETLAPNAHGKAVSEVAQSDAVGGKNCNHGGAVSEAAKKDHGADKAARDAAKAAREAARETRRAERAAAHRSKEHGKPGG